MKTTEDFIKEMESSCVLISRQCTFKEYVSDIIKFQDIICKMIAGNNYHENMRFDEALFIMESTARKKKLRQHPAVNNGILTMKKLVKEMAITMSGSKGENLVFRTLEFLNRPKTQIFRNVYITDGVNETELDGIVLTDSGVIILEVKQVKSDLTLTEDGRMVFTSDECFDKIPLAQKMALKRNLLKKHLVMSVASKGLDFPIYVDSFIVFSAPKGQFIKIEDKCHHEKYCFRTGLNKKIESYASCTHYSGEQFTQLSEIFSEMESNVKRFETKLNYDEVRRNLAEALAVLQDDSPNHKKDAKSKLTKSTTKSSAASSQKVRHWSTGFGYAATSMVAGLLIFSAASILHSDIRQS